MRATLTLLSIYFYALSSGTSSADDRRWLVSLIDLVELDYEDHCEHRATATWNELIGADKGLTVKLEGDKAFGIFSRQQTTDVRSALTVHALGPEDDILRRKVKLLLQPGDTLLETEQWIKLVTFGDKTLYRLRFATDYDCGGNTNCTLKELQSSLSRQQDEDTLKLMRTSWVNKLPSMNEYLDQILPLLRNASKENKYTSVEQYWDTLGEYEGALLKARELWDHVKPLYTKLQKYIALRLKGPDAVGNSIPVHLLRSLTGNDWSNLIEYLLPKHADVYQKIHANLQLKDLGGQNAYKLAAKFINDLNLGEIDPQIWSESLFNSTCPATLVDWCKPNKVRVVTCKDVSIGNYIDAHETAMKIKYKMITALHSNNTYILREASRYSAVYEAIPGFVSLLAINPHALDRAGLYSYERFSFNQNHNRLILQLIMALKDLPRLNFYMAADEWRLNALTSSKPTSARSWSDFRRNFSKIETTDEDILGHPNIVFNKPFIGKFMGLILKYQIYQSYAEELMSDDNDLTIHVSENNGRLMEAMMQGFGMIWPEMVSDLLVKRENGLEGNGLTDYFRLLDDYLDNELDPTSENEVDEYVNPPETPAPVTEGNDIPNSKEKEEFSGNEKTYENIEENLVDSKIETSTITVLEIKNPVPVEDQAEEVDTRAASYNTYWWIGIIVALAIVVILIAIIARKRHNHRKELERQRRDNTRA